MSYKKCFLCGRVTRTERHHIFGAANRKFSEQDGLVVYLCRSCHNEPPDGVHFNIQNMRKLQRYGQRMFEDKWMEENNGTREQARIAFMLRYGRNYIWEDEHEED